MYCQTCGASNSDDAKFCNQCGGPIARAGDVGGPKPAAGPGATAVGIGGGNAPIATPGSTGSGVSTGGVSTGSASTGSAKPAAAVNVWEQQQTSGSGGGPSMMSVSLETIGVRSTKKVWAGIGFVALILIALGALGSWLLRPEPAVVADAGHAQPEDPFVIGTPLPPGEPVPAPSEVEPADIQGSSAMFATMSGTSAGVTMSGTTSGTSTMSARGGDTSAMIGTSTMTDSTGGTGGSTGTSGTTSMDTSSTGTSMTGSMDTGSMDTGSMDTGSMDTSSMDTSSMDTGSTGGSGTGSTGTPPNLGGDLPEERDLELELYGSRVRFVVQRYYAARAQTCFDRATRNNPSVSGTVVVNMTIGAEGNVSNTSTARNTTGDEVLGNCLRSQVASWQLPPPPGGSLEMQMPFSR